MTNYERIRKSLTKINNTIQRLVCEDYQIYLKDAHTSRERLKSLRTVIKLLMRLMKENVRDEYENLLKRFKRISLDRWLNRWVALASRLRAMSVPNLSESHVCKGFIQASETVNPTFYNSAM